MAEPREFFAHPGAFFDLQQGGFAFYGGAIASTVGGAWVGKIMGFDVWKFADTCAPLIMLGLAIGRWGCFFAGCCHGGVVPGATVEHVLLAMPGGDVVSVQGFPWLALEFKRHIGVGSIFDQPLYPTQLWESAGGFALFLGLSWLWRRGRRFDGQVMATLLLTYPILRSTIEMYRGDTLRGTGWFGFLSTSQVVSVGVLALGAGLWLSRMGKGLAPEQEFTPPEDDAVEPA